MITGIHSIRNRKSETRWKVTEDSRLKEKSGWLVKKSEEKEKKSCSKYYPLHLWSYQQLIWLYVTIMSRTSFRVNLNSIVCLNVKELLAWSRCNIWSLSDSNGIQTHNHVVLKRTFNCLPKLIKWFSRVVSAYLYGTFDSMLLSCHIRVLELIHTL